MACIIIVKNKKSGNEYAYQSVSYRDPITKKPRNKRAYLGRVDPVSGKIIPVQKQGRKNFTKSNQEKIKMLMMMQKLIIKIQPLKKITKNVSHL